MYSKTPGQDESTAVACYQLYLAEQKLLTLSLLWSGLALVKGPGMKSELSIQQILCCFSKKHSGDIQVNT
jgi:hypothetical protein